MGEEAIHKTVFVKTCFILLKSLGVPTGLAISGISKSQKRYTRTSSQVLGKKKQSNGKITLHFNLF